MTPQAILAMRRLLAHFDTSDPSRKAGRRQGTTESPYAGDFEFEWDDYESDVRWVIAQLTQLEVTK